jgi:hypothetical protein
MFWRVVFVFGILDCPSRSAGGSAGMSWKGAWPNSDRFGLATDAKIDPQLEIPSTP